MTPGHLPHPPALVIPVKALDVAKSRLDVSPSLRRAIALVLAERTLGVAASCLAPQHIHVVTSDEEVSALAHRLGATVVLDLGHGLNAAVATGIAAARTVQPDRPVCVMVADLPHLTTADLSTTLALARSSPPFVVPDQHDRGTTFLSLGSRTDVRMLFGMDSSARFAAAGLRWTREVPSPMRHDLDVVSDLALASPLETVLREHQRACEDHTPPALRAPNERAF